MGAVWVTGRAAIAQTPVVDPKAVALLRQVNDRMQSIRTLSATCIHTYRHFKPKRGTMVMTVDFTVMRPNFARAKTTIREWKDKTGKWTAVQPFTTVAANGNFIWRLYATEHQYQQWQTLDPEPGVVLFGITTLDGFYDGAGFVSKSIPFLRREGLLKAVRLEGRTVAVVRQDMGSRSVVTDRYTIGNDLLIHRIDSTFSDGSRHLSCELKDIRIDKPMSPGDFAFVLPADYHPRTDQANPELYSGPRDGTLVDDFMVKDGQGKPVRLSDFKGKTVVLDFWATWCGNCLAQMPLTNALARKAGAGVVVLEIDVGDSPNVFRTWLAANKSYGSLRFLLDPEGIHGSGVNMRFNAGALPTQVVIGPDGRIAGGVVGYDGRSDDRLERLLRRAIIYFVHKQTRLRYTADKCRMSCSTVTILRF